jgi:hypothetical protein
MQRGALLIANKSSQRALLSVPFNILIREKSTLRLAMSLSLKVTGRCFPLLRRVPDDASGKVCNPINTRGGGHLEHSLSKTSGTKKWGVTTSNCVRKEESSCWPGPVMVAARLCVHIQHCVCMYSFIYLASLFSKSWRRSVCVYTGTVHSLAITSLSFSSPCTAVHPQITAPNWRVV